VTNLVFASCNKYPDLQPSDAALAQVLEERGAAVRAAPWNGPQEAFANADAIVVRSTWDYPTDIEAFTAWLGGLAQYPCVINSPDLMGWNLSKRYLESLAAMGAPLPPTRFVEPSPHAIEAAMESLGLVEAVVKPEIGATASGLSIVRRGDARGLAAAAARLGQPGLVQPKLAEIETFGETSMMFADGEFTHAVIKRAKSGDIRVQEDHCGVTAPVRPPDWAIDEAKRVLAMIPEPAVYARVDAIILDAGLWLMEVELIEPDLFLNHAPDAAGELAASILRKLK